MTAKLSSVYLAVNGLLFLGLGIAYLAIPSKMAAKTDYVLSTSTAVTELRAVYGGMEVALGLLLCACAFRQGWLVPGLVLAVGLYAGFGGGRLVGVIVARSLAGITWKLLAFEAAACLAGIALLVARLGGAKG